MLEGRMLRSRYGYTVAEMIVVLIIFGVVTALSIPRLHAAQSSAGLRSARTQTAIFLAQAHALAIQRGREAHFVRSGNVVSVTVDSSGTQVIYGRPHDLSSEHGVTIPTTTQDTIKFDARGFATNISTTAKFVVTRDGMRDSVCVAKIGKIITRGCSL
jgi:prepilin-type N-terminal cleavage/methylation domain-containing protein